MVSLTSFIYRRGKKAGFTLIELSIVLVIIGLIIGGVLTGQDLIKAAAIRAQLSQIEKYNTAVRAFQGKYGYLPGDIPDPQATNFGFQSRGSFPGEGDGNGVIEGNCSNSAGTNGGFYDGDGELAVFWVDLSTAGLIDAGIAYNGAQYPNPTTVASPTISPNTTPSVKQWLPTARMSSSGQNLYLYVYSYTGLNYYSISPVTDLGCGVESTLGPGLTVQQAYMIDKKADDGLPQSGSITACYVNHQILTYQGIWSAGGLNQGAGGSHCAPATTATVYATTNCFDNNGIAGIQTYSVAQNANLLNCALSFKFQ